MYFFMCWTGERFFKYRLKPLSLSIPLCFFLFSYLSLVPLTLFVIPHIITIYL